MNPTAPILCTTIKRHKQNTFLRLVIKWRNSPAYEIVKHATKPLHTCLHLPNTYTYNNQNSIHLTTDLQSIEINEEWECFHSPKGICILIYQNQRS